MSGWLVFTLICSTNCADRDGENNSNLISYVTLFFVACYYLFGMFNSLHAEKVPNAFTL